MLCVENKNDTNTIKFDFQTMNLSYENTSLLKESKDSYFGFNESLKSGVIRVNEIIVGFFTINIDHTFIDLQELEILDQFQNKGIGTEFIKQLFILNPNIEEISGNSLEDAVGFYESLSAKIFDSFCDCEVDSNDDTCDNYSNLIFSITRKDFINLK